MPKVGLLFCLLVASPLSGQSMLFGGDVFVSTTHTVRERPKSPLVVNLEGAWCSENAGGHYHAHEKKWRLCLDIDATLKTLSALNVKAVSLSNNHSKDAGASQKARLQRRLEAAGITVIGPASPFCDREKTLCALSSQGAEEAILANATIRELKNRGIKVVHHQHRSPKVEAAESLADVVVTTGSHQTQVGKTIALGNVVMDCACVGSRSRGGLLEVGARAGRLRFWSIRVPSFNDTSTALVEPIALDLASRPTRPFWVVDGGLEFLLP